MASNSQKDETVRMSFVLIPRFNMMALTSTIEPMRVANYLTGKILFSWDFLSSEGGPVTSSNGMPLETIALTEPDRKIDRVFVCGSWDSEHYEDKALFAWLRRLDRIGVHLGAMDIGTYILARAGLMGGYRAAILWYCSHAFAEAFPDTIVEEMLYVTDRKRSTIAGGAAGMDMMLDDISRRHTPQFAHEIAEHIIHHQVRGPETLQRTLPDTQFEIMHPSVRKAITMMYRNVEEPLSIPEVAEHVNISQRKMERLFQKHVGRSAIAHYRLLRLQHARVMLTNTNLSIREISVACGYLSLSHFAKSFAEQYGRRPRDCREAWPLTDPAPVWPGLSATSDTFIEKLSKTDY